ncbi:MAG: chemotaxis protein CheB, partial [Leptolyngbyaceae cyanobacterium MAG.088]|nr:chemotaxis protein CheB [Leptolyngbyaceae cyanobacterium MAG.088]
CPITQPAKRQTGNRPHSQLHSLNHPIKIVAIGVSTGGPNALTTLFSALPHPFPVPIVIVQHMPPLFTKRLAERLTTQGAIPVLEGDTNCRLQPGKAWIAPGNFHMVVERQGTEVMLQLHQAPPENSCRPSVDVLFRSVTKAYGGSTLGLILTGMGQDGLHGCESIREVGGQVFVQDEASSVVWGMPGIVAQAGLANQVLPLEQMADAIMQRVGMISHGH